MIQYVYFVSYWYKDGDNWGVGNSEVTINAKITGEKLWKEVEKKLANPGQQVFLNNFILVRTEDHGIEEDGVEW